MNMEEEITSVIDINWSMFEIVTVLGKGAYGNVYKVKCLKSTTIAEGGTERVLLNSKLTK